MTDTLFLNSTACVGHLFNTWPDPPIEEKRVWLSSIIFQPTAALVSCVCTFSGFIQLFQVVSFLLRPAKWRQRATQDCLRLNTLQESWRYTHLFWSDKDEHRKSGMLNDFRCSGHFKVRFLGSACVGKREVSISRTERKLNTGCTQQTLLWRCHCVEENNFFQS